MNRYGAAIASAVVSISDQLPHPNAGRVTVVSSSGEYTLDGLAESAIQLCAEATGYSRGCRTVIISRELPNPITLSDSRLYATTAIGPPLTIGFSAVQVGSTYGGHTESEFTMSPSGAVWFGHGHGTPGPAIHFNSQPTSQTIGIISIAPASGVGLFGLSSVNIYSSTQPMARPAGSS